MTSQFLDVLDQKNARATFYVVGQMVESNPGVLKRIHEDGHAIGNHSWSHENLSSGGEAARASMVRTSDAVERVTGRRPATFRPPYGATSAALKGAVRELGMTHDLWDIDTRDWERPGADAIHRTAVDNARDGAVMLMHDAGGNRSQTLAALPRIIDTLRARGYEFVTVDQL